MANRERFLMTLDLTRFRDEKLCPACKGPSPGKVNALEKGWHEEYATTSAATFGDKSLPLCWDCYRHRTERCPQCFLPCYLAFSSELGTLPMHQTTMVKSERCLPCQHCQAKGS